MHMKSCLKVLAVVVLALSFIASPLLGACSNEVNAKPKPTLELEIVSIPAPSLSGFDAIQAAIDKYLTSGSSWNIKAEDLFLLLNDDDKSNDPFIISVRKPEDYAKGHIPGAVNIPFADIAKDTTLAGLPKDKKIVIYCYTGHSGSQATAMLGALGFDVVNLLHGMSSWTKDTEVAPKRFDPETKRKDYDFETTPNEAIETYPFPTIDKTVTAAAQAYTKPKNITNEDLFLLLNDDDKSNDPFIISVRKPEDYAKGHIPGAVNFSFTSLAKSETLTKLNPDRPIVVYCYTGHTGSQATALLNMLGYDATNLLFGMVSWTKDTEVAPKAFDNETSSMDYDFETTPNVFVPGVVEGAKGFDAIQAAVNRYLASGSSWNIKAEDLFLLLNDDDKSNDPFIISVRKPEDYAKGHIPGAVNIPFADIAKDTTLAGLPKDKKIVIYCYTGHSGSQATAMLGALGFDVVNLLHGMSSWTKDTEVAPKRFDPETKRKDYDFETTPNEAIETYPFPTIDKTVTAAAQAYTKPKNITNEDLFLLLNDDDKSNDPFIISVRKPEDYAKGHIPGAVNFSFTSLAKSETLTKLNPDRPIVVYCYTGHTGSQATALLNMLGYDATNLLFGMVSWTKDTEVAPKAFDNETSSMDYDFETTPNVFVPGAEEKPAPEKEPTSEKAGTMTGSTCIACHSNENLLKETAAPIEEEAEPEEPSGEG